MGVIPLAIFIVAICFSLSMLKMVQAEFIGLPFNGSAFLSLNWFKYSNTYYSFKSNYKQFSYVCSTICKMCYTVKRLFVHYAIFDLYVLSRFSSKKKDALTPEKVYSQCVYYLS